MQRNPGISEARDKYHQAANTNIDVFLATKNSELAAAQARTAQLEAKLDKLVAKKLSDKVEELVKAMKATPNPVTQHLDQVTNKLKQYNEKQERFKQVMAEASTAYERAKQNFGVSPLHFSEVQIKRVIAESTLNDLESLTEQLAKDPLHPFAEMLSKINEYTIKYKRPDTTEDAKLWDTGIKVFEKCKIVIEQDTQRKIQLRNEIEKLNLAAAREQLAQFQKAVNEIMPAARAKSTTTIFTVPTAKPAQALPATNNDVRVKVG